MESTSLSATRTSRQFTVSGLLCSSYSHCSLGSLHALRKAVATRSHASVNVCQFFIRVCVLKTLTLRVSVLRALLCCAGLSCQRKQAIGFALDHEHGSAPVCYQPSTCRLATGSSSRGLTSFLSEKALLGAGFPLRCCQRLSLPNVATQRCRLCDNWYTSGSSSPVLSY